WLKLRPLAYKNHSYQWPTIGKEIAHIEDATMDDVRDFFYSYYIPNNAYMVVAGNVTLEQVKRLSQKWFAPIPSGTRRVRNIPQEAVQTQARFEEIGAKVPLDALYKVYHMSGKLSQDYYATDLLSDILGRGKSSRLYDELIQQKKLFTSINGYIMSSVDPGLLVIDGKLNKGVSLKEGDEAITELLEKVVQESLSEEELNKVKNQAESTLAFGEVEVLNRAMNLSFAAMLGDAELVNKEAASIQKVTTADVKRVAATVLKPENCSTLYYRSQE
ncbi:MAG: insulinase family protein, partial [Cytophagales bacterium]|nr:insulinase family protein [Cytophaga sp.]